MIFGSNDDSEVKFVGLAGFPQLAILLDPIETVGAGCIHKNAWWGWKIRKIAGKHTSNSG